jgi:hypothetical protein
VSNSARQYVAPSPLVPTLSVTAASGVSAMGMVVIVVVVIVAAAAADGAVVNVW